MAVIVISICAVTSCRKDNIAGNNNVSYQGGSWTFGALPYNATSCAGTPASAILTASGTSVNGGNRPEMTFSFADGYPAASGAYTVINGHNDALIPLANIVMITAAESGAVNASYYSTGEGTQTVNVTVANGKISISGSGVQMANSNNISDVVPLSFTITQTQ